MKASHLLSVLALLCFALLALPARSEELTEEELAPEPPASLDEEALEEGNHEERSSCYVPGVGSGTCQYNYYSCAGTYRAGYCPGASNYQCCVRPTTTSSSSSSSSSSGSVSCTVPGVGTGRCQATSTYCAGSYRAGYCPGASNVQCCVAASSTSGGSTSGGSTSGGATGRVDYRGYTISDADVRNKLALIAGLFPNSYVFVTSGNRNNGGKSHHDVGRAADFWIGDGGGGGLAIFNRIRQSGILARDYQIIWHGTNTCTGGQHIHIGRYADGRVSCWVHEGTNASNRCVYRCM